MHPSTKINSAVSAATLDIVQLHGDEAPEFLAQIRILLMRALRWGDDGQRQVDEYLSHCAALECIPQMLLARFAKLTANSAAQAKRPTGNRSRLLKQRSHPIPLVLAGA